MKIASNLISKTILRNLVLLAGIAFLLSVSPKVFAGLTTEAHCDELTIGPATAWCIEIAWCNPAAGDRRRWAFLWLSNNTICPGNNPPVLDSTKVDGRIGDPRLVGTARSTTIPAARIIALGIAFAGCDGVDGSTVNYFFQDCNPIIYPPPPFPDLCWGPGCYPAQPGNGCSYCAYNWTINAACQGPFTSGNCGGGPFVLNQN
jgi:hypothetical protein